VRRGGHERAAGLLLLAEPVLHDRERPGQVADLVVDAVVGDLGGRSRLSQLQRRLTQPPQPAYQPGRQRDPEDQAQCQARQRGVQERPAHGPHRTRDLADRLADRQHVGPAVVLKRDRCPRVVAAVDESEAVRGLTAAEGRGHVVVRVIVLRADQLEAVGAVQARVAEHLDDGADPVGEALLMGVELIVGGRRERHLAEIKTGERPRRAAQVVAQGRLLGVAQALLQRAEQRHGRHCQRRNRGNQDDPDDPPAQPEGPIPRQPSHG
jgi:hypothetical protein